VFPIVRMNAIRLRFDIIRVSFVLVGALLLATSCSKPDVAANRPSTTSTATGPAATAATTVAPAGTVATKVVVSAMRDLAKEAIPSSIALPGPVHKVIGWTDANGENVAVFTLREVRKREKGGEDTGYLDVQHIVNSAPPKVLRHVRDQTESCDADMSVSFSDEALGVTDLDSDGIGELTFAYRMNCTSDYSPATLKLLVTENGDKYILRGSTYTMTAPEQRAAGGDYKADFGKAPPQFLEHAKKVWAKVRPHSDTEAKALAGPKKGKPAPPCKPMTWSDAAGAGVEVTGLLGKVGSGVGYDWKDRPENFLTVVLDEPLCLEGESVREVQLNPTGTEVEQKRARTLVGKRAAVTGVARLAETAQDHRPIVIQGAPSPL
jgi:hypothetical protein